MRTSAAAFCSTRRRGASQQDVGLRRRRGAGARGGDHLPGHEFADAIDGMAIGDFRQDIAEVGFRIQFVEPSRLHESVDRRGPLTARIRSGEQIILSIMDTCS